MRLLARSIELRDIEGVHEWVDHSFVDTHDEPSLEIFVNSVNEKFHLRKSLKIIDTIDTIDTVDIVST